VRRRGRSSVRLLQVAVGVLVLAAAVAVNGPPLVGFVKAEHHRWLINTTSYKRHYGHWSVLPVPAKMRVNAIHAALLYTGKVLIIAGSGNNIGNFNAGKFESLLWDPKTDKFRKIRTPSDMFCGGHAFLPDGKLLIAGGTVRYEQLASQVHFAAGVMTVTNRDPRHGAVLPKGTAFAAPDGRVYRTTAPTVVPRASQQPSSIPTWVSSTAPGAAGVTNVQTTYAVQGAGAWEARGIKGSANSLTLDQQDFWGSRESYIFDPASERYEKVPNMTLARWYPTLVGLADGRVLSVSGLDQFGRIVPGNNELFDPKTGRWSAARQLFRPFPTYPALFLMLSGNLFFTGSNAGYGPSTPSWRTPGIWNLKRNRFQPVTGMRDPGLTETSGSLLLPPAQDQRYAIVGGGGVGDIDTSTGRIDVTDLRQPNPRWQPAAMLPQGTRYPEVVITPDDKVVIAGGSKGYRGDHGSDLLECHLFDPSTNRLSKLASPTVGRDYHSEALLLPDGRIITLGGNPLFGNKADTAPSTFEQRIEIFTPPYLYKGTRPVIASGPRQLARGQSADFSTSGSIAAARLIRPTAVTHVTDVEQRSIALPLQKRPRGIRVTVPASAGLVPPGWYMLFARNAAGVPSDAYWVRVV
jgi:Galactose oxidase-like, Early set domain/GlxA beta barrel domain